MKQAADGPDLESITYKLNKLQAALAKGLSRQSCLRRWSEFIRERDGHRCVDCHSRRHLSAHHICRKSFFTGAQFLTGNGITLCSTCHRDVHRGFNARPNLMLPLDTQGGEKLSLMERLYSILTDDAVERGLMRDAFYFLSDEFLVMLKRMQGFDSTTHFPGSRIEQAYLVLAECELETRRALAEANGMPLIDQPLLPGGLYLVQKGDNGQPSKSIIIRTYVPRTKPSS